MQQRAPNFERRRVERGVRRLTHTAGGAERNVIGIPNQTRHRAVRDRDSFRNACRTGGVHHVGNIPAAGFGPFLYGNRIAFEKFLHAEEFAAGAGEGVPVTAAGQHHGNAAVFNHPFDAFPRIGDVERNVAAARF